MLCSLLNLICQILDKNHTLDLNVKMTQRLISGHFEYIINLKYNYLFFTASALLGEFACSLCSLFRPVCLSDLVIQKMCYT